MVVLDFQTCHSVPYKMEASCSAHVQEVLITLIKLLSLTGPFEASTVTLNKFLIAVHDMIFL